MNAVEFKQDEFYRAARVLTARLRQLVRLIDYQRRHGVSFLTNHEPWNWNNYNEQPRLQQLVQSLSDAINNGKK